MVPSLAALAVLVLVVSGCATLIVVRRRAMERTEEPPRLPCRGSGGGLLHLSARACASFVIEVEGDDAGVRGRLAAAIVARGEPGWIGRAQRRPLPERPLIPEPQGLSGGGTLGGIWARVDVSDRVAWIGAERVPLPDGHNVVLLDRADGIGGPSVVVRTLSVEPEFALPGPDCGLPNTRGARARDAAIKAALFRSPEVRVFVEA
ncbi:hypothetical protein BH23GEM5_BH23GEM5_11050 [soil metagenome]